MGLLSKLWGASTNPSSSPVPRQVTEPFVYSFHDPDRPFLWITPAAQRVLRQIATAHGHDNWWLRIRTEVIAWVNVFMSMDTNLPTTDEFICECAGFKVVMSRRDAQCLKGYTLDLGEEDGQQGFKFNQEAQTAEEKEATHRYCVEVVERRMQERENGD